MPTPPGRQFLLVGLTGGIATGKSTVSTTFRGLGCVLIDADVLAREVVAPGEPALAEIVGEFGPGVLGPDGSLNRKALGAVVFADPARRRRLEAITHPRIRELLGRRLAELAEAGFTGIVIFDAAVIVESGNYRTMDRLVVVVADEEVQIERLMRRDGISREEALRKIRSQMPLSEKARLAHYVIDNSGDRAATEAQVRRVYAALEQEARSARRLAGAPTPLAALFFRDAAHYGHNAFAPKTAAARLRSARPHLAWVAYHRSRPSAVLVIREPGPGELEETAQLARDVIRLDCVPRTFPDLIRLEQATPVGARATARGSIVVGQSESRRRIVVVMLDREVPTDQRRVGRLSPRVEALTWASSRDIVCLYQRPPKHGSNGQVERAVVRALTRVLGPAVRVVATARAMGLIKEVVGGQLGVVRDEPGVRTGKI